LRLALALIAFGSLAFAAGCLVWLRIHIVPPDCADAATLGRVRQSLTERFGLPASVTIEHIRTLAGGYVGFRFVCEAALAGIDPQSLPAGSTVPGSVRYISQLTGEHRRHEVTVSVAPRVRLERVQ